MTWRPRELAHEARVNLGPRHLAFAVVAFAAAVAVGLLTSAQARAALEQDDALRAAGSLVWTAAASDETPLSAATCEALNREQGVDAAGGIATIRPAPIYPFSGAQPVTVEHLTVHALSVWTWRGDTGDVIVGTDLEDTGTVALGSVLMSSAGEELRVDARTPGNLPMSRLRSGLLVPRAGDFGLAECWARMAPGSWDQGRELLAFSFAGTGARVTPFTVLPPGISTPADQWRAFAELHPWSVGGATIGLVALLTAWTRRPELAVYRAFGTRRAEIATMLFLEHTALLVPVAAAATTVSLLATAALGGGAVDPDVVAAVTGSVLAAASLGLALSTSLSLIAVRGTVVDDLKDR